MHLKENPFVAMIEELILFRESAQRILSVEFSGPSLTRLEGLVLVSIVGSAQPMTAPQIGRALGHPRQVIQRSANRLQELGLIEEVPNPDHKTAHLLKATAEGMKHEEQMGTVFDAVVSAIFGEKDLIRCKQITRDIHRYRKLLETHDLKGSEN